MQAVRNHRQSHIAKNLSGYAFDKHNGKNTVIVVSVEAKTAAPTGRAAHIARNVAPSSQRKILSRTTMELSTNIPTPSAKPPKDIISTTRRKHGRKRSDNRYRYCQTDNECVHYITQKDKEYEYGKTTTDQRTVLYSSIEFLIKID